MGRPFSSQTACSLALKPPTVRPICQSEESFGNNRPSDKSFAGAFISRALKGSPPFGEPSDACCKTKDLHNLIESSGSPNQFRKGSIEQTKLAPTDETIVNFFGYSIIFGGIAPA